MTQRLLLSYLALTLVVLAVLEIPLGLQFADEQTGELIAKVQRDAFAIAGFAEESLEGPSDHGDGDDPEAEGEAADPQAIAEGYEARTGGRVVIVDDAGFAVADSSPPAEGERYFDTRPEIQAALDGRVAEGTRSSDTLGERIVYVAVPVTSGGTIHGAVRITYPTTEVDGAIRDNWIRLAGIGAVTLMAASALGIALAHSVVAPLRQLQRAATELGAGDLTARASESDGPPEVRALARAFNDMAVRLERVVEAQESFVAEASHQMRSPLTALRLRLENLEATVGEPDRLDVEAAGREVARLSRLVDGLLALARADRVSGLVSAEHVDLGSLLEDRRAVWEPLAAEHQLRIEVVAPPAAAPGTVSATPDRLVQVLDNLIANAIDASPPGGTIHLGWEAGRSREGAGGPVPIELHVVDEGAGLPVEERERAFDRFWRASGEAGRLGGTGLGLAIVQKLARADGGEVELRAAPGGGLDAVVTLLAP